MANLERGIYSFDSNYANLEKVIYYLDDYRIPMCVDCKWINNYQMLTVCKYGSDYTFNAETIPKMFPGIRYSYLFTNEFGICGIDYYGYDKIPIRIVDFSELSNRIQGKENFIEYIYNLFEKHRMLLSY